MSPERDAVVLRRHKAVRLCCLPPVGLANDRWHSRKTPRPFLSVNGGKGQLHPYLAQRDIHAGRKHSTLLGTSCG